MYMLVRKDKRSKQFQLLLPSPIMQTYISHRKEITVSFPLIISFSVWILVLLAPYHCHKYFQSILTRGDASSGKFDHQAGCQTEQAMNKAVSVRKDPFNPSKAVEEDQVKTMGLGSSVR